MGSRMKLKLLLSPLTRGAYFDDAVQVAKAEYLAHFPERPDFQTLRQAMPSRSEKGVRNAEARFMSKLQEQLRA